MTSLGRMVVCVDSACRNIWQIDPSVAARLTNGKDARTCYFSDEFAVYGAMVDLPAPCARCGAPRAWVAADIGRPRAKLPTWQGVIVTFVVIGAIVALLMRAGVLR